MQLPYQLEFHWLVMVKDVLLDGLYQKKPIILQYVCVCMCVCGAKLEHHFTHTLLQWMIPSTGHLEPTWVKCLIIDTGNVQSCFITVDAIGRYTIHSIRACVPIA